MHVNLDGGKLRNKEIPDGHQQKTIPLIAGEPRYVSTSLGFLSISELPTRDMIVKQWGETTLGTTWTASTVLVITVKSFAQDSYGSSLMTNHSFEPVPFCNPTRSQ